MDCDERLDFVEKQVQQNAEAIEEIANTIMGTPRSSLSGGGRHEDGLVHKVDTIEKVVTNGGMQVKIPAWFWLVMSLVVGITQALSHLWK